MGFNVCVLMCMLVCARAFVRPPAMSVERMYWLYECVCVCVCVFAVSVERREYICFLLSTVQLYFVVVYVLSVCVHMFTYVCVCMCVCVCVLQK